MSTLTTKTQPTVALPEGYYIITNSRGRARKGDLKWCPIHHCWEPVNQDHKGRLDPFDFAPVRSYKYLARKKPPSELLKPKPKPKLPTNPFKNFLR